MQYLTMPETLKLDYLTWRCGHKGNDSCRLGDSTDLTSLLSVDSGRMCCLGQFSKQAGVPEEALECNAEMQEVYDYIVKDLSEEVENDYGTGVHPMDTVAACEAIKINDDGSTTIAEKVVKLQTLFGFMGYNIELVNFPKEIEDEINEKSLKGVKVRKLNRDEQVSLSNK